MNNNTIWFVPAFLVAIGIFLLSTFLSFPMQVEGVDFIDKWQHCFAYFFLIASFMYAFKKVNILSSRTSIYLLIGGSLYGLLLELAQYSFFPNRYFEWIDALANVLGVILGFLVFKLIFSGK